MRRVNPIDKAIDWFCEIEPETRRRAAFWMLIVSFVLGHVNIGLFVVGIIPPNVMDAITNYLSWLALTITAIDIVIGTDIRAEGAED